MTQMTNEPRKSDAGFYIKDPVSHRWEQYSTSKDPWQEGTSEFPPYVDELRNQITYGMRKAVST